MKFWKSIDKELFLANKHLLPLHQFGFVFVSFGSKVNIYRQTKGA